MFILSRTVKKYDGFVCRRCLNELYRARLEPPNCLYETPYPRLCPRCGQMRNIVTGLSLSGRIKTIFK